MPVKLNSSGGGSVTIDVPSTASAYTLTAPAATATLITTGSSGQIIPKAALPTGSILQITQGTYQGATSTTSASFQTTNLTGSITPLYSTSRIYVIATGAAKVQSGTTNCITLYRNGSNVVPQHLLQHSAAGDYIPITLQYLDSPGSTSAVTYTVYFRSAAGSASYTSAFGGDSYSAYPLMIITMMEIAG